MGVGVGTKELVTPNPYPTWLPLEPAAAVGDSVMEDCASAAEEGMIFKKNFYYEKIKTIKNKGKKK